MKKLFVFILTLALALSVAACGASSPTETADSSEPATDLRSSDSSQAPARQDEVKKNESDAVESEDINTGEGDTGLYHIKITGASSGKDYEENNVITITYEWTNNSDETTSALVAILGRI